MPGISVKSFRFSGLNLAFAAAFGTAAMAESPSTAFVQTLASAAVEETEVAEWYRSTGYEPLWTGADDLDRRVAFLTAIRAAPDHGLPVARYDAALLMQALRDAETEGDRALAEVAMTRAYLAWARDLTSGVLTPSALEKGIPREIAVIDPQVLLKRISAGDPEAVLDWLLPESRAYLDLMKAKIRLEAQIAEGGWGEGLPSETLQPGDSGPSVVALRDRLVRMGYLAPSATALYDKTIEAAVVAFQSNHGLTATGEANGATLEALNIGPEERLKSVLVAMERERWLDIDRSTRHIWVNLPDFHARIYDKGRVLFETRVVIGKNAADQQSPEFSDLMEHMVINPSWGVPRSIIVKEYLPQLQADPYAAGHLQIIDGRGRVVPRGAVDFTAYSAGTFPFDMRQPPSDGNA
nr:peptidoglycan-binding protein [Tabrizicola sp.]